MSEKLLDKSEVRAYNRHMRCSLLKWFYCSYAYRIAEVRRKNQAKFWRNALKLRKLWFCKVT